MERIVTTVVVSVLLAGCFPAEELYYDSYEKKIDGSYYYEEPKLDVYAILSNDEGLRGTVQVTERPDEKEHGELLKDLSVRLIRDGEEIECDSIVEHPRNPYDRSMHASASYVEFYVGAEAVRYDEGAKYEVEVSSPKYGTAKSQPIEMARPFVVGKYHSLMDVKDSKGSEFWQFYLTVDNPEGDTYYTSEFRQYSGGERYYEEHEKHDMGARVFRSLSADKLTKKGPVTFDGGVYLTARIDSVVMVIVKYSKSATQFCVDLEMNFDTYNDAYSETPHRVGTNMVGGYGFCGSCYAVTKTIRKGEDYMVGE